MKRNQLKRLAAIALLATMTGATAGCSEYLARRDSVSFGAGDAKAHNAAVHMVDPWARHAFRTDIRTPGSRAEAAMDAYRKGQQPQNSGNGAPGAPGGTMLGGVGQTGAGQ